MPNLKNNLLIGDWRTAALLKYINASEPVTPELPSLVQHAWIVKKLKAVKGSCDTPDEVQAALLENHIGAVERAYAGASTYIPKAFAMPTQVSDPVEVALWYMGSGYSVIDLRNRLIARVDRPDWQEVMALNIKAEPPRPDTCHWYRRQHTQDTRAVPRAVADIMPMSEDFTVGYVEKMR